MNERIQELADKIWAEEYWNKPNTDKLLPAQLNRFAELIVRECADLCDRFQARDVGMQPAECAGAIRKMFGVEE